MPNRNHADRCARVNAACKFLPAKQEFFYRQNKLWMRYTGMHRLSGMPVTNEEPVKIIADTYLKNHRIYPWGGNQGQALSILAQWIRTGKMPLTFDQWRRWCGPPVMLGNPEFLEAIRQHIYGGTTTREEIMEALVSKI